MTGDIDMNEEDHHRQLIYLEIESHVKGQIQRESRLIQLRTVSFAIVTGAAAFVPFNVVIVPLAILFLGGTLVGLFLFDWYYCKLSKQESMRISELTIQSRSKGVSNVEVFPKDDQHTFDPGTWYKALGLDHMWYLFIFLLASGILVLRSFVDILHQRGVH